MNKISLKKSLLLLTTSLFLVGGFFVANLVFAVALPPSSPTTNPATTITSSDATLNGTNGDTTADDSSFWVSTNPSFTITGTNPAADGAFSTPVLGSVGVGAPFSASLTSVTGLPAVTPNTTYYFVAWSDIGGVWSHGAILNFTTTAVCSGAIGATLLDVTQNITNDVDSGNFGNWALDAYARHIQVWLDGTTYCAQADYSGTFQAPAGVLSPNNGTPITQNINGTFAGRYRASIVGTPINFTSVPTAVDYQGVISTGAIPGYVSWLGVTFNPGYVFHYLNGDTDWSWTYSTLQSGSWTNAGTGSSGDIVDAPPSATTNPATDDQVYDATINGTNGPIDATGHSFWVSLAPFSTVSPTIPDGVYSTPDLGAISAGSPFSATLSSITTTGVPTNLPAITSSTRYYFVAWSLVGGTWYPGEMLSVDTVTPFENPPAPIVHISALPLTLDEGGTSVITYTTENIDGCTKTGDWSGSTEGTGSDTVGPLSAGTYTYTLNCNGNPGTHRGASGSVTVTVNSIPRGGGGLNTYGTPPPTAPTGEVLGASTGPNQREIPGCDMRTIGFSITTGESCENNIPHHDGQVLGAETFQFTRTLRYGMTGDDVLELHKKLAALGFYKGPIDNGFGHILEAAVKAFQKANPPLKIDGIVGAQTRELLNK